MEQLNEKIEEIKKSDASKLEDEYAKLVEGLRGGMGGDDGDGQAGEEDDFMANPILPTEILDEAVPGNIRRAEHFTAFLARFVEYLKASCSLSRAETLD